MPTFDPKDLPSYIRPSTYDVTSFQSSLQRSFERWLEAPSPTSEKLVDQALIGAGREPLFAMSASRDPRISSGAVSAQQNSFETPAGRATPFRNASGRFTSPPSYSGPAYADPRFNGPSGAQQFGSYRGTEAYAATTIISTREAARLFKHIDQTLDSMNRAEHQILELSRTSTGQRGGARGGVPFTQPSWIPGAATTTRPFLGATVPPGLRMPPMPLGGGGGGGGGLPPALPGGGGGGGGGGGNAFTGGLLGGALGRTGFWGAVAGEGATLAARWPLHLGHVVEGVLRSSSPYADWQSRLADMTALPASIEQSGRSRRLGLERDLLPYAGGKVPGWMSGLGITPQMGADILGRMGGGVQTGTEPLQMIQNFRELRLGAGFRMAPEGSAEALGMLGQKYGITQPGQQAGFPGAFAQYMAQGQSGGADVKDLLKSISESTEALVKTGIKLDLSQTMGWADFLQRMATVNLPGAQSGQMGGNIISGMQGAGQHPFANPVTATIFSQLINQTDWSDPAQVKKLLGKTPEEIMSGGADWEKTGLGMLQQGKTSPLAMLYGSRMIGGSSEGLARIGDIVGKMGGGGAQGDALRQMLMGSFLGQDFVTGSGALAGLKAQTPSDIVGAAKPMPGTLPTEVFRSQTEAFTTAFRGMRADFEEFGSRIHWVNNLLDTFGGFFNGLSKTLFGREVFKSGVPEIPPGGQKIPGGYEAPIPGSGILGAMKPSFGADGEYGVGQGVIPSGGSKVPSGGRQQYGAAGEWATGPSYAANVVAPNDALNNWGSMQRHGDQPGKGRWRSFDTPEAGVTAIADRLQQYAAGGVATASNPSGAPLNTIGGIVSTWAPGNENNTEQLIQRAEKWMGVGRNEKLDMSSPEIMRKMTSSMIANEHGGVLPRGTPQAMIDKSLGFGGAGGGGLISGAHAAPMPGFAAARGLGEANFAQHNPQLFGNPWSAGWAENNLTSVKTDSGAAFRVNKYAAPAISGFLRDLEATGYKMDPSQSGGYNLRNIRGSNTPSSHAFGTAIDINWNKNPFQTNNTDMPPNIQELADKHGMIWGANWSRPDPMHFEWSGKTADEDFAGRSGVSVERRGSGGPVDKHDEDATSPSRQNFSWDDIHDAVGFLGRMARETGEHLSDLGHGARSARSGMASPAGPNTSTSPSPNPAAAAYP